ncbi:MAG: DnaA regulatory inactivator Hda [Legionellales bacterium]|nr:DnaA regulatory inactivator Hda [Legionellales bacterium]
MTNQLSLGVNLRDDSTLDSFFVGSNAQAWSHVKTSAAGKGESFLYIWGESGSGVTHLLQGACQLCASNGRTAMYLPLSDLAKAGPSCLEGLEQLNLVCLDDIHEIRGNPLWEERVFHLFNLIRDNKKTRLIIGANAPPKQTQIQLADLVSRLTWGVTFQLITLSDGQIVEALKIRAQARGLILSDEVAYYLLRRCPRTMSVLYQHLDTLDKASLVAQKKLTIPFVKSTLCL